MTINEFVAGKEGQFGFGISPNKTADALRQIADDLDSGRICLQSVRLTALGSCSEYPAASLRMTFVEKLSEAHGVKELYGSHQFPVDVHKAGQAQ